MKKSGKLYLAILITWLIAATYIGYELFAAIIRIHTNSISYIVVICILMLVNVLVMTYIWFGGIKNLYYMLAYAFNRKKIKAYFESIQKIEVTETPKVLLLYCTYNDFIPTALEQSMKQDYCNFETIILDDSKKEEYKQQIDDYAQKHPVTVIRREDRVGFKAGNINNYLKNLAPHYDYFVVLDSDEVIPPTFITEALKYFYTGENNGAVQARHIADNNRNAFMEPMGLFISSDGFLGRTASYFYGQTTLFGHGMMVSKEAYDKVGGFPHIVAEDTAFSAELLMAGYKIAYAYNIECYEEYPIDYLSFKKQICKYTQSTAELIGKYRKKLVKNKKLKWYEKFETLYCAYNLPLMPLLSIIMIISFLTLSMIGQSNLYSSIILIPTIGFMILPIIGDLFLFGKKVNFFKLIWALFLRMVIYASVILVIITTTIKYLTGHKATFIITPKQGDKNTFLYSVKSNWKELVLAAVLLFFFCVVCGSISPIFIIEIALVGSIFFTMLSNKQIKNPMYVGQAPKISNAPLNK